MIEDYAVAQIPLQYSPDRAHLIRFLASHELRFEDDIETAFGVFDADEDAASMQAELDIAVFAQKIAPALHITMRFADTEPFDPVTGRYNDVMRTLLPKAGIAFCELPRCAQGGQPVSASCVRSPLEEKGVCDEALVPEVTQRYLMKEYHHGAGTNL